MGLRMKNYGGSLKNSTFRGGSLKTNLDLRYGLEKKRGGSASEGGLIPNGHHET